MYDSDRAAVGTQTRWSRARARIDGSPPALTAIVVGLALFLVYLPTATFSAHQSPDPIAAYIPAHELATSGSLTLDDYEGRVQWFKEFDGRIVSDRAPGVVFFGVPFYFVAQLSGESAVPAAIAASFAAAAAMSVLHLVFLRLTSPSIAMGAALVAGLGTATWTVSADGLWPHGPAQLWLALALLAAPRRTWLAGAMFGLAVFTRPQTAVAAAVFGLALGWYARSVWPVVKVGVGSAIGAGALVVYNTIAFGAPSLTGGYEDLPQRWISQLTIPDYLLAVVGTLVSPDRGVLLLSPFLIVLAFGLPAAWRHAPPLVKAAAFAGVGYILVYLLVNRFSGGNNFYSYRLPIEALTLGSPLLVLSYVHWVRARTWAWAAFWLLVGAAVAIHAIGAIFYRPAYTERAPWNGARISEAFTDAGLFAVVIVGAALVIGVLPGLRRYRRRHAAGTTHRPQSWR